MTRSTCACRFGKAGRFRLTEQIGVVNRSRNIVGYCLSSSRITGSHGRSCSSTCIAKFWPAGLSTPPPSEAPCKEKPDPPRTDADANQKIPIGHPFAGPPPLAHEVPLPERGGMAFPEIVPGVWGGVRVVALPRLLKDVAHRQPGNAVSQSLQRLPNFGVFRPVSARIRTIKSRTLSRSPSEGAKKSQDPTC